jgi:hypothetical protein
MTTNSANRFILNAWRTYLRRHRLEVSILVGALILALWSYTTFLTNVENRAGVSFADPLHVRFGPIDCTWPIFILLYGALGASLVTLRSSPSVVVAALRGYLLLISLRIVVMWATPFDPPSTMIALNDPFVALFTGTGTPLTRDLMFSGHVSVLCVVGFVVDTRWLRTTLFLCATVVGVMVIAQHVHYTVDVLVAPLAAYAAAAVARR